MRNLATMLCSLAAILFIAVPAFAQEEGDYRTRDDGDWSNAQIWERYNGSAWVAIGTPPDGTETITIQSEDSVWVDVELTLSGHLIYEGILDSEDSLTVADGGVFEHAQDEGDLPDVRWEEGSTFLVTGVEATAPGNRRQNYHHIIFDTPGLLANLNMDLDSVTVSGDITVRETNFGRWYLTSAPANEGSEIVILGDVIVEGGAFSVHGTSNAQTTFVVHHYGDINVTGGNFSVSRGSQGLGTTTWHIYEGDFYMANATTQSSTITPEGARFVFEKDGTQTLTLENVEFSALPIEVSSGTTLDMGASTLGGSGFFLLNEGAGLETAVPGGIEAIFEEVAAEVTLEENANFTFDGTEAQITSEMMPVVVADLTIDNPEGVTLSQETTINGVLTLRAGVFDNTTPFELGPNGSISEEGGSLLVGVSSESDSELPQTFFVEQNFPNPFNPTTVIRYGLPASADVTIRVYNTLGQEVRMLSEGHKNAGMHEVAFEAGDLSSGMYIYRVEAGDRTVSKTMVLVE